MHTFFVVLKGKNRADKPDGIAAFVNDRFSSTRHSLSQSLPSICVGRLF
jgi:hypothetical protein